MRCAASMKLVDKTTELNLYRIAQEAVCNALRHSKAQRIDIKLSGVGEHYRLSIEDDGIGFPDQKMKSGGTLGLRSMRSRADLIGAEIEVRENPTGGASIVITSPKKCRD